ncbi:MAG: helix-turn-helix domain-containing protein [Sarcina sp.]
MNFLSTGEKIKRARIYKGVTLKELCKKDISISKMSCIENDKIKADKWILEMVAKRLDLDVDYLLYNDIMELTNSIKEYQEKDDLSEENFDDIKERINYCILKEYNDLALKFVHIIFSEYTRKRKFLCIKEIINIYNKFNNLDEKQQRIYYEDLGKYFLARGNNQDAITYFSRARNHIANYTIEEEIQSYIKNSFFLAITYYKNNDYIRAKEILINLLENEKSLNETNIIFINGILAAINIVLEEPYSENIDIFESYNKKNLSKYNKVLTMIATSLVEKQNDIEAFDIIKKVKKEMDSNDKYEYVEILIMLTKLLLKINNLEIAKNYCEEALELSIKFDNNFFIEKSYLYKAKINRAERSFIQWEMNMNLATDVLIKFANSDEKIERYREMAEMYHVIGELRESIKYLTLSINLEKHNLI